MSAKTIAVCNHKGGVGKTVTTNCLGMSLANAGKKVLMIDFDPQGNLTKGFGFGDKSAYAYSIKDVIFDELNETQKRWSDYPLHLSDNADLIPSNIDFSGFDLQLVTMMSRETVFKRALEQFRSHYDYILVDCSPGINLYLINTLTAADSIIIPVQAEPYAIDGMADLLHTVTTAKKQINPSLSIEGILITMTDARTNLSKHISSQIREVFGDKVHIFKAEIPRNVKTAEASLYGKSPIDHAPGSLSSRAYNELAKEVQANGGITRNQSKQFAL